MKSTPQLICDIIKTGMGLNADQIWIYNQRRSIPEDERLYIVVGMMGMKPYGNVNVPTPTDDGFDDSLSQYMLETISIDIMSYTTEAIERYAQVLGSLISSYSQEMQEALGLKIAEIPVSVNDVSKIEGATLIYRIAISLNVFRKYDMLIGAKYYDTFEDATISKYEK